METKMTANETPNKYDLAANDAEKEMISILDGLSVEEKNGALAILQWQAKHYMKAGHKRLGRILVKLSGETK
jgi:hypothetical protein